jgi:aspartyl-tRNA(Asn)/glutamyl-tRNA(Gln) amidotransferase subunit C
VPAAPPLLNKICRYDTVVARIMIDDKTFEAILSLCKFNLSAGEREHFKEQIAGILSYVETLEEVDTKGVDPDLGKAMEPSGFRPDEQADGMSGEEAAALSPHFQDEFFTVPRIIEDMEDTGGER